jgi:hypothetical protein
MCLHFFLFSNFKKFHFRWSGRYWKTIGYCLYIFCFLDQGDSICKYPDVIELQKTNILCIFYFLAPGGSIVEDPDPNKLSKTHVCVFGTEESIDKLKAFYDVSNITNWNSYTMGIIYSFKTTYFDHVVGWFDLICCV